ncbi:ELWxxDGT repeat protein [Corallococcus sp. CA054B]|uniref:ELWxxDGT repeat protein n=1 Tax=Corallococcus sp. CA054B TaxID=2316734 RepID=UPI0011C42B62|nr:ELWxxDGT repeat protein [Corallococcus sp. CA054B]
MGLKPSPGAWATFLLTLGASLGCGSPSEPEPGPPPEASGPQEPGPTPQEEQEQPGPVTEAEAETPLPAPLLLKDVIPQDPGAPSLFPASFVELGAIQFFTLDDGIHGQELWRTDGTPEGTAMVADLMPGALGSNPASLIPMGGRLYFVARTLTNPSNPAKFSGSDLHGLWHTDGTAQGTEQVVTLGSFASFITEHQGVLYFEAPAVDESYRARLWRSDGTPEGTWELHAGGAAKHGSVAPAWLGDSLFFPGTGQDGNPELWKTDGTKAGTVRVARLMRGDGRFVPLHLTALNGRVLFWAHGEARMFPIPWTSDGTEAGTVPLKDLQSGLSIHEQPSRFVVVGNTAFFSAWDAEGGQEVWKTDGTPAGTVRVKDLWPGPEGSNPGELTVRDGRVYFSATARGYAPGVWRTDGTVDGTVVVAPLSGGDPALLQSWSTPSGGRGGVFYSDWWPEGGHRVWHTDGTGLGTVPLLPASDTHAFTMKGWGLGLQYFTSTDGTLWATDGTPEGTRVLRRFSAVHEDVYSAKFTQAVALDGALYFTRRQQVPLVPDRTGFVTALWRSDGTAEGTRQVNRKAPGVFEHEPTSLTPVNGHLLFVDERDRKTLWTLDARTEEVRPLTDLPHGDETLPLTSTGTQAWFVRKLSSSLQELWRTDGTPEGMALVASTPGSSPYGWTPHLLTPVGQTLYFASGDASELRDSLWKTDGTPEGTVKLKTFAGGLAREDLLAIYPVGSRVYFRILAETHQLWVTDGTAESSRFVSELPGDRLFYPGRIEWAAVGDTLFLSLGSASGETPRLWKTDGRTSGVVRALPRMGVTAPPVSLTANGDQLLFWWTDGAGGFELWKSDGTEAGTVPVKDLHPGAAGSVAIPGPLVPLGPKGPWVFAASNGATGVELWRTDGTAQGTKPLADVLPGPMSSSPANLVVAGDRLFFSAWTPETGREPWVLPLK